MTSSRDVEPTLGALLSSLSQRIPDWGLVAMAIGGLVTSVGILLVSPPWWRVVVVPALLSAFGAWGMGERERATAGPRSSVYVVLRAIAAVAAFAALAVLVLEFFGHALGTWIS